MIDVEKNNYLIATMPDCTEALWQSNDGSIHYQTTNNVILGILYDSSMYRKDQNLPFSTIYIYIYTQVNY